MTGLDNLFENKGIFSSNPLDRISKGISKITKLQEVLTSFDFQTSTNPSTSKELELFSDFNKNISTLDDIKEDTPKESEDIQAQTIVSTRRVRKCKKAPLPDSVKNLVVAGLDVDKKEKEETLDNLSQIYADPYGKKLIDKMVENNTIIEIHDPENDMESRRIEGYYSPAKNKIVLFENNQSVSLTIHELGHSVTGQDKKDMGIPENDGNSFEEEIGTDLMAEEMVARMKGTKLSEEKARSRAKEIINACLDRDLVRRLENGFYEHIETLFGLKIQNKFDVKELCNETKAERKNKSLEKLPE